MSPVATPVPSEALQVAIGDARVSHVVTVPDTHQRTLLERLTDDASRPLIRAATEDDVFGICTGLWLSGHRPLAVIQQLGLFAAANSLRWVAHDVRTPLPILAGLYGRDVEVPVAGDAASAVRLCPPLLEALQIRYEIIDHPSRLPRVPEAIRAAFDERDVRVVLLGAPTA
jgi:sulfopyruvate decarboxylase TPP-binding subunit